MVSLKVGDRVTDVWETWGEGFKNNINEWNRIKVICTYIWI